MTDPSLLSRVAIVGSSCAGKSTLARELARKLQSPHIELDAFYWGPNWTPNPLEEFRSSVESATAAPSWVCDGNYQPVRDIVWPRATTIIWLNYSFPTVFRRALARTFSRCFRVTTIFAGNRETFRQSFFSRDSVLWWLIKTYGPRKREFGQILRKSEQASPQIIEIRPTACT